MLFPILFLVVTLSVGPSPETEREKARLAEAISLAVAAEYEKALDIFEDLLKRDPEDPVRNYYVGMTYLRLNQIERGAIFLERSVTEEAPFPEAYYWLGQAYLARGKKGEARDIILTGLKRFPRNEKLLEAAAEVESQKP